MRSSVVIVLTGLALLASWSCGNSPTGPDPAGSPSPVIDVPVVLVGAGDIGWCGTAGPILTGQLLDHIPGIVFTAGDNAQGSGATEEFDSCFGPAWGRHRHRIFPCPGNHDYNTAGAAPYFAYFGTNAGPPGLGYYSYDVGAWHAVSLNSNVAAGVGSLQEQWLRADLTENPRPCTVAYWHHPVFSSGGNGPSNRMREIWRVLYEFNVDLVLNGHNHFYERFAPQDPDGRAQPARGIRQFTIGTGGAPLYGFGSTPANLEIRNNSSWGVLKLTLSTRSYDWEFIPVAGHSFRDVGTGRCVE